MVLYPSWIEIPAIDLDRAVAFYTRVFQVTGVTFHDFDEAGLDTRVAVLQASDKTVKGPGVSLVQSARHQPHANGVQVNFHVGSHDELRNALQALVNAGGIIVKPPVELDDGVRYAVVQDTEGNTLALSAYDEKV
jgi:predicted enzyme related to lactoylglutathione lyase